MRSNNTYEKLDSHVFVTKLAGFEHSEYIQPNATREKVNPTDIPMVQGKNIRNGVFVKSMTGTFRIIFLNFFIGVYSIKNVS